MVLSGLKALLGALFVFLCRNTSSETCEETSRALVTYCREEDYDDEPDAVYGAQAEQWRFEPMSHEAGLCVTVDAENPKEMLERELSLLVRAVMSMLSPCTATYRESEHKLPRSFSPFS